MFYQKSQKVQIFRVFLPHIMDNHDFNLQFTQYSLTFYLNLHGILQFLFLKFQKKTLEEWFQ